MINRTKIIYCGIVFLMLFTCLSACDQKLVEEKVESFNYDVYKEFPVYSSIDIYGEDKSFGEMNTAENAAKVAEKIWFDAFGDNAEILEQRPYVVSYDDKDEIWLIEGNRDSIKDRPPCTAHALIAKDGKLITCWHEE